MRHLSASYIGGHFLHESPVLAPSLVCGRMLEEKILLDSIRCKLNSRLLVGNRPFCPYAGVKSGVFDDFCNISRKIHTGVIGFEQCVSHFVINQAPCAFRLCYLCWGIVVYHIHDVDFIPI